MPGNDETCILGRDPSCEGRKGVGGGMQFARGFNFLMFYSLCCLGDTGVFGKIPFLVLFRRSEIFQ